MTRDIVARPPDGQEGGAVAGAKRQFKKIRQEAENQGWWIEETKKGYILHAPNGVDHVTTHRQPTEAALKEIVSDMKRVGYRVRGW